MSRPLDKDASETAAPAADRPGRVEFDSRGNSVWRWARDVLESTTIMLRRLDNKDLALEPTQKVRVADDPRKPQSSHAKPNTAPAAHGSAQTERPAKPSRGDIQGRFRDNGGGFDPYNSR